MTRGDFIKVEVRDSNYKLLFRGKFNLVNKKEIKKLLVTIEKFSGVDINHMISIREWI